MTNENYHKVYDALTAMKHVDKVDFLAREEQYDKLIKTAGKTGRFLMEMPILSMMLIM